MADKTARPGKETKRTDVSGGIMDITDTPDVAAWSKEIRSKVHTPSDKVKEPSKVASTTLHAKQADDRPGRQERSGKGSIQWHVIN